MLHRRRLRCSPHFILVFAFGVLACTTNQAVSQVSIKEKVSIFPGASAKSRIAYSSSFYLPCGPAPQSDSITTWAVVWYGDGQSYAIGPTYNCNSHDCLVSVMEGGQYVRIQLSTDGWWVNCPGKHDVSAPFHYEPQSLCLSVIFDQAAPADTAVVRIRLTAYDVPSCGYQDRAFIVVRPKFYIYSNVPWPNMFWLTSTNIPIDLDNQCQVGGHQCGGGICPSPSTTASAAIIVGAQYGTLAVGRPGRGIQSSQDCR